MHNAQFGRPWFSGAAVCHFAQFRCDACSVKDGKGVYPLLGVEPHERTSIGVEKQKFAPLGDFELYEFLAPWSRGPMVPWAGPTHRC